jgi:NAD(P)-dependent dehydrogenase (short-subunit alcohol dehydrogenase family)
MSDGRFSLAGKVALVSGASRGIGRAIAMGFAEAGADVALAARSLHDLESLAQEIQGIGRRARVIETDVMDPGQIDAMVGATVHGLGALDVLVNNAGGTSFMSPMVGLRQEGWDKVLGLNLTSVFRATQAAARHMIDGGGGSIIQIASVAGVQGAPGLSNYSAAKGGVISFTRAVARELAGSNIRVNALAPGWIATDLNSNMRDDDSSDRSIKDMIPMERWGRAEEIVGPAIFLASDASSFTTGATLLVDGGQSA